MKITVLYNTNTATANDPLLKIADDDTIKTASAVFETLSNTGHDVKMFDITEDSFSDLLYIDTDFYFNISEGVGSIPKSFVDVAKELEKIDVPFSGSSSFSLALTTEKAKMKELLRKKGICTPSFYEFDGCVENIPNLTFPLIVKPGTEDSSVGIDGSSVVYTSEQLETKLSDLSQKYADPILIEEYVEGREFAVTVVGNGKNARTLPIYEIQYENFTAGRPKIFDYKAKWDVTSKEYEEISMSCPTNIDDQLKSKIEEIAVSSFNLAKCSDYARVDMRLTKNGEPNVLEINANPGIGPEDETISSAKAKGISYEAFLHLIIVSTLKRFYSNTFERYQPLISL